MSLVGCPAPSAPVDSSTTGSTETSAASTETAGTTPIVDGTTGTTDATDSADVDSGSSTGSMSDEPVVFLIAGQSNAEGNVFIGGLEGLAQTIPEGVDPLTLEQRDAARMAVAEALGGFCGIEPGCVPAPERCEEPPPFSHAVADMVIDELRVVTTPWRSMDRDYQHPSVTLVVANYDYAPVVLVDGDGTPVPNEGCSADPATTERVGPELERFTPTDAQPLGPGFGTRFDREDTPSFGPELTFGEVMGRTYSNTHLIKVAMGGSSLHDHWRPDGPLYASLVEEAQQEIAARGARLGGLLWFQGFNDQFEGVYCEDLPPLYAANLAAFLGVLRTDLDAPELPVVIVGPRSDGRLPEIAAAQQEVASGDPNIVIVESNGLSDCFHYGSGAIAIVGERAGLAMTELQP